MYYKVVQNDNGIYISAISTINDGPSKYIVEYKIGENAYPHKDLPNSKLFVFNDLFMAEKFSYDNSWRKGWGNMEVWDVKVINPQKIHYIPDIGFLRDERMVEIWKEGIDKQMSYDLTIAPKHTFVVDSVKLIKKVEE